MEKILVNARKTGTLNLPGRSLTEIPQEVYRISDYCPKDEKWWELGELKKIDFSHNEISRISPEISKLSELQVLLLPHNKLTDFSVPQIYEVTTLNKLDISNNRVGAIPDLLGNLSNLASLSVATNALTVVPPSLGNLELLVVLDISHNRIASLPDCFHRLINLTKLDASHNALTTLPPSVGSLPRLSDLNCSVNQLRDLPPLSGLKSLTRLELRQNRLTRLPVVSASVPLAELYLGHNNITALSPADLELFNVSTLKTLDISDNSISVLPDEIARLKLVTLDIQNNDLSNLPASLGTMTSLHRIQMEGNAMKAIRREIRESGTVALLKYLRSRLAEAPEAPSPVMGGGGAASSTQPKISTVSQTSFTRGQLASGPQAQVLDVSDHALTSVDLSTWELATQADKFVLAKNKLTLLDGSRLVLCERLQELVLDNNQLTSLPDEIGFLPNLVKLSVNNNALTRLPATLDRLPKLTHLSANQNSISVITALPTSGTLAVLALHRNALSAVPACLLDPRVGSNLVELNLSNNRISDLWPNCHEIFKKLEMWDMGNNNLSQLSPYLGSMTQLKMFEVQGNALRTIRQTILSRGTAHLLEYLRSRIPS